MRIGTFIVAVLLGGALAFAQDQSAPHNYRPPEGYVPDAAAAIQIAVAVWGPIYGKKQIASEKPYIATLNGDVWTVLGSMHCKRCLGGVALAEISKRDGTIMRVSHGQ